MAIFNSKLLVYQKVTGGRGLKTLAERTSAGAKPRCWTSKSLRSTAARLDVVRRAAEIFGREVAGRSSIYVT
jgi:hypothetical protein